MFIDDLMHDEEPESRAFAHVLGREEGIKDPLDRIGGNSLPRIVDLDIDGIILERAFAAIFKIIINAQIVIRFVESTMPLYGNGDVPPILGHGIYGILDQV